MNVSIISEEIESETENLLKVGSQDQMISLLNFCQTFEDELTQIPIKLFQNIEEEGTPTNIVYEANIDLIAKTPKNTKYNYPFEERFKNPQINTSP